MNNEHCIFIDGNALFHAVKNCNKMVDYTKLLKTLTADNDSRAFFYTGVINESANQQKFLFWMRRNGYRVITKEVTVNRETGKRSCDLKPMIIADMMAAVLNGAKTITLVSGDEDYAYALEKLFNRGITIIVAGFPNSISNKLLDLSDYIIDFNSANIVGGENESSTNNGNDSAIDEWHERI